MKKRGQSHVKAVIYAMIVIIIGLTIIWGYKSFKDSKQKAHEAEITIFKEQLQADFSSLKARYGSVKEERYEIPGIVDKVCFLDFNHKEAVLTSPLANKYPLIISALESDAKKNLFIIQKEEIIYSFTIDDIMLQDYPYFICIDTLLSALTIKIEGRAKGVLVLENFKTSISGKNEITSYDRSLTLKFTSPQTLSIQPINPNMIRKTAEELGSEAYSFLFSSPPAITASTLEIIYDPIVLGENCPSSLKFQWYDENEDSAGQETSSSINCNQKKVFFSNAELKNYGHLVKP